MEKKTTVGILVVACIVLLVLSIIFFLAWRKNVKKLQKGNEEVAKAKESNANAEEEAPASDTSKQQ